MEFSANNPTDGRRAECCNWRWRAQLQFAVDQHLSERADSMKTPDAKRDGGISFFRASHKLSHRDIALRRLRRLATRRREIPSRPRRFRDARNKDGIINDQSESDFARPSEFRFFLISVGFGIAFANVES